MKLMFSYCLFAFSILLTNVSLQAEYSDTTSLPSDQEINSENYGKDDAKYTVLWLHSERGVNKNLRNSIKNIVSKESVRVILPDFHDSYFMLKSRSSFDNLPQQDIEDYISALAEDIAPKRLYVFAMSRSAGLALNAAQSLQKRDKNPIAGIIFLAPYLQVGTPEIGQKANYLPIASQSNLPLYLFQAERSPRFIPLPDLVKTLESGGSPTFVHILKNIHGGFQMRDRSELEKQDIEALETFPKQVFNALSLLDMTDAAPFTKESASQKKKIAKKKKTNGLQKVNLETPALNLKDLDTKGHKLTDYKGKIVIVSFWASWCRPCLEEIPSLVKLKEENKDTLEILAVNIREEKDVIKHFTQNMNINFPIVRDMTSESVKDWNVYVYPSNFIVDKTGKIQYAATGAMDWQDEEINTLLKDLIKN